MGAKQYYWIKFHDNFFNDKRIKRLRQLAGGDTFTIIYLKMQLRALQTEGFLYFDNVLDDFYKELALDLDENPDNVKVTIQYLLSVGLLEISPDGREYFLPEVPKNVGSETASAKRVRAFRERKKNQQALQCNATNETVNALQCNADVTKMLQCNADVTKALQCNTETLQCNAPVTDVKRECSVEIEIEKDIDIDKRESIERKKAKAFFPPTYEEVKAYCEERQNHVDVQRFIDFYSAKGWMIGKNKMKDWKAAVRTWERDDDNWFKASASRGPHNTFQQCVQRGPINFVQLEEQLLDN